MIILFGVIVQVFSVPDSQPLISIHVYGIGKVRHDQLWRGSIVTCLTIPSSVLCEVCLPFVWEDNVVFPVC